MRAPVRLHRRSGFTLIELVIVMGILVMVLTATYRLIVDCIEAERTVDKITLPEKVGEGILSLFRADLSGTIWRHSGTQVFYVIDQGTGRDARDEIRFLSTVEPTPIEDPNSTSGSNLAASIRTITGVAYFLKPNQGIDGVPTATLYRKEIIDFLSENPLLSPGVSYEVYDKVAYLSIECYEGFEEVWLPSWDSEIMIEDERLALEAEDQANEGIARVSELTTDRNAGAQAGTAPGTDTRARSAASRRLDPGANALTQSAPGVDPTMAESGETELVPPAAVPSAVRVEIGIYAGQGNRIERDQQGNPLLKTYATIVPILTAQRIRLPADVAEELGAGGVAGAGGEADGGASGVNVNDDKTLDALTGGALGKAMGGRAGPGGGRPPPGSLGGAGAGGRARLGNGGRPQGGARLPGTTGASGARPGGKR